MRRARKENNESSIVSYLRPLRKNFAGIALNCINADSEASLHEDGAKYAKRLMRQ